MRSCVVSDHLCCRSIRNARRVRSGRPNESCTVASMKQNLEFYIIVSCSALLSARSANGPSALRPALATGKCAGRFASPFILNYVARDIEAMGAAAWRRRRHAVLAWIEPRHPASEDWK